MVSLAVIVRDCSEGFSDKESWACWHWATFRVLAADFRVVDRGT